ncbi:MAG: hypothetical protein MJZ68_08225 [archaeon]|nr:hypothetical protein [archaeon]
MEKLISDATVKCISDSLSKNNLILPLDNNDIETLLEYFEMLEITLSNNKNDGEFVDEDFLNQITDCVDELAIYEDDEYIDLESLNLRLKYLES